MPSKADFAEYVQNWWHLIAAVGAGVFAFFGLKIKVAGIFQDVEILKEEVQMLRAEHLEDRQRQSDRDRQWAAAIASMSESISGMKGRFDRVDTSIQSMRDEFRDEIRHKKDRAP